MERLGTERLQQHYNVAVLPHEFRNAETSAHSIAVEFDVDQRADIGADVQEDKYENGGRGVLTEAERYNHRDYYLIGVGTQFELQE